MPGPPGDMYSIGDVTARTSLSRGTIHHLIGSGRLRAVRLGRRVMVRDADLNEFIESLDVVEPNHDDVA